jgi:hypothetical protein
MVKRILGILAGIVALALLGFVVAFTIGLYTAMDSLGKPYAPASATSQAGIVAKGAPAGAQQAGCQGGGALASEGEATASAPLGEDGGSAAAALSPSSQVPVAREAQAPGAPADTPSAPAAAKVPSDGGSAPAPSVPTAPQRVWHEPVYETVRHEAVYATVHHEAEYATTTEYYTVCRDCDYRVQGSIYPHQDATGHTGYATDVPFESRVLVQGAWDEQVLVSAAFDEQVLVREGYWG